MKAVKQTQSTILVAILGLVFSIGVFAQDEDDKVLNNGRVDIAKADKKSNVKMQAKNDVKSNNKNFPQAIDDNKDDEAKKVVSYYSNYLAEYKLGPNDIISVEVFGQCPDYCKTDVIVPPTARISYPLIRNGVVIGGKTTYEVADDVTKKLEEYIIDPKVTVSLVRAGSARYSVMGKVVTPGIRIMDRRVSIYEAIIESGGIAKDGDKKKIFIARFTPEGRLDRQQIDFEAIESGKASVVFLKPGDQVIVGKKGFRFNWDTVKKGLEVLSVGRFLLGSPL